MEHEHLKLVESIVVVSACLYLSWKIIKHIGGFLIIEKEPITVLVTVSAGYSLVPMIALGLMLSPDQPLILHLLNIKPAAEALKGVKMELLDAAFPLLSVVATTDVIEACKGIEIAMMLGGFPRKEGMERKDVTCKIVSVYKAQALALGNMLLQTSYTPSNHLCFC